MIAAAGHSLRKSRYPTRVQWALHLGCRSRLPGFGVSAHKLAPRPIPPRPSTRRLPEDVYGGAVRLIRAEDFDGEGVRGRIRYPKCERCAVPADRWSGLPVIFPVPHCGVTQEVDGVLTRSGGSSGVGQSSVGKGLGEFGWREELGGRAAVLGLCGKGGSDRRDDSRNQKTPLNHS